MKSAWLVLLISAFTDFVITAATAAGTVIAAIAVNPDWGAQLKWTLFIAPILGGIVAGARTIQQALKATPETTAQLKGQPVVVTTITPDTAVTTVAPQPKP
jgi:membrane protein implicated in regulation of membrane protease activity